MTYQTTSSLRFSNPAEMTPDEKRRFVAEAMRGAERPMTSSPGLLVNINAAPEYSRPMRVRDLSTKEVLDLFDKDESLVIVYVPHFVTQCVMYYVERMLDYTSERRMEEFKRKSRAFKALKDGYISQLRREMPKTVFDRFLRQREEYLEKCGADLTRMFFTFKNEVLRKHPHMDDGWCVVVCYALVISSLIRHVENFDLGVNREISRRIGAPTRNHGDARLSWMKTICDDILNTCPVEDTEQTALAVRVIHNKAIAMIREMVD